MAAAYTVYVRTEYPTAEGIFSSRAEVRARKESFQVMADTWVEKFLPLHFQPGNRERYGFTSRSDEYLERKRNLAKATSGSDKRATRRRPVQFDGEVDLVFHGDLAKDVTSNYEIKAYPSRATITLGSGALPYLISRPRRDRKVNMANEIRVVTDEEMRELVAIQALTYFTELNRRGGAFSVGGETWIATYEGN